MAKSKCKWCENRIETDEGIKTPVGFFCDIEHAFKYGSENKDKGRKKLIAKRNSDKKQKEKKEVARTRQRKKELMTRTEWYNKYQKLVNQYITKVRDVNEGCCTCGSTSQNIKYDAGHFFTRASRPDIRFELTNIHKQCSIKCNAHGSGMRKEYAEFIVKKYGKEHLEWLECEANHKALKEQYPHWSDIEKDIDRYRGLLREGGVNPCA